MPQPTVGQVHINRPLTNVSVAYVQSADSFIAGKVFPSIAVDKKSDILLKYTKHDWMRDDAKIRAPGTEATESGFNIDTSDTYKCVRHDLKRVIPDDLRDNADEPMDMDMDSTEFLTQQLLIRKERIWASTHFVDAVWGTSKSPGVDAEMGTLWSDYINSDPAKDVKYGRGTILTNTGRKPNTIAAGWNVAEYLADHPLILSRFQFRDKNIVTKDLLALLFQVKDFHVCEAVYSASVEGNSSPTYSLIQGDHMLLCYVEPSPSKMRPSAGYTFNWKKFAGNNEGMRVKKYRNEDRESDMIEVAMSTDMKLVCTDCGFFYHTAV